MMTPSGRLNCFVGAVAAAGAAGAALVLGVDPPLRSGAQVLPFLLAVGGLAAAELLAFHYRIRDSRHTISFFEVVICVAFSRLAGGTIVAAVAVAALIAQLARRQQDLKALFNVSQFTLGACAAVALRAAIASDVPVSFDSTRGWLAVAVPVVLGFGLVNLLATVGVIALAERRPLSDIAAAPCRSAPSISPATSPWACSSPCWRKAGRRPSSWSPSS